MCNTRQLCALLLALAVSPAGLRVQSFRVAVAPAGRMSRRGVLAARGPTGPSCAVRGCSCGAGVAAAAAGLRWQGPAARARRRGGVAMGMGAGGGEAPADFALSENTVEELWRRVKKQLISVGKGGVKPSHVRSLNSLVAAHTLVKVKVNIPNADLAEVGLELAGGGGGATAEVGGGEGGASPAVGVSVVTINPNQNIILFANTEFLASESRGEVFGGEPSA